MKYKKVLLIITGLLLAAAIVFLAVLKANTNTKIAYNNLSITLPFNCAEMNPELSGKEDPVNGNTYYSDKYSVNHYQNVQAFGIKSYDAAESEYYEIRTQWKKSDDAKHEEFSDFDVPGCKAFYGVGDFGPVTYWAFVYSEDLSRIWEMEFVDITLEQMTAALQTIEIRTNK